MKYVLPKGRQLVLDAHPLSGDEILHGRQPLYITEGILKADALRSRGRPTIGLIGVWTWMRGGHPLLEWDRIPLRDRKVRIIFGSDISTNSQVRKAALRLADFIREREASPIVLELPSANGTKTGVDDYLASGGRLADIPLLD
jgi:hypothetical protein